MKILHSQMVTKTHNLRKENFFKQYTQIRDLLYDVQYLTRINELENGHLEFLNQILSKEKTMSHTRDGTENFLLKETFCNITDVLYEEKLNKCIDIYLKFKVIPNEVNAGYHKFKLIIFNLLDGLIGLSSNPST